MAASGARLVEVGTTNKTHARDYENAITENTAAILRVHPSNYKIVGFTAEVPLGEMADIAHGRGLVMIDDVGAGALLDFSRFGFPDQPILADSIRDGADILMCSADKLIGGPQGGIILGKAAIVEKARKNPLARIVRVDKITLAALEATLSLFLDEETALREVPTLAMLSRDLSALSQAAERIANAVRGRATGAVVGWCRWRARSWRPMNLQRGCARTSRRFLHASRKTACCAIRERCSTATSRCSLTPSSRRCRRITHQ
jgi:L-seryl-tRNA(Ser) seleniumtransferase